MNCDGLARWYRWLEYLTFGPILWQARVSLVQKIAEPKRVLLLGEGDGRFAAMILAAYPGARVTTVELSAEMLRRSGNRVRNGGNEGRVHWIQGDLRHMPVTAGYDLVVTNFVLDCLTPLEVAQLAASLARDANVNSHWLITEFGLPHHPILRNVARLAIQVMYRFFQWTTGLQVRKIAPYGEALEQSGFRLLGLHCRLAGFVRSEIWERRQPDSSRPPAP